MRSTLFFLSLLLCVATGAQIQSYELDFTLSKKQFADTIGIRYEREKVLVPVVLGEQGLADEDRRSQGNPRVDRPQTIAIDGKPISTVSDYQNYPHLPNQTCTFTVRDEEMNAT